MTSFRDKGSIQVLLSQDVPVYMPHKSAYFMAGGHGVRSARGKDSLDVWVDSSRVMDGLFVDKGINSWKDRISHSDDWRRIYIDVDKT